MAKTSHVTLIDQKLAQYWEYRLSGPLEDYDEHNELIDLLNHCSEDDVVDLVINSPGGRCDVGNSIIRAIKGTKAHVTAVIAHPSASMASIIALSCHDLVLEPGSYLMFHNYSAGVYGKGDAMHQEILADKKALNYMFSKCSPFLNNKEMKKVLADGDVYIHWDCKDLMDRIDRHFKNSSDNAEPIE